MKEALSTVAVIVAIVSYIPYIRDMIARKTRPSAITWCIWALLTGIAFFAQLSDGAGVGAVALGVTTVISVGIFLGSLRVGSRFIARVDWYFMIASLLALCAWWVTDGPLLSVILITIIDGFAYAPTVRKTYVDPYSETLITHFLSGIKFMLVIAALESYTVITVLYPLFLVFANCFFTALVLVRRRSVPPTV